MFQTGDRVQTNGEERTYTGTVLGWSQRQPGFVVVEDDDNGFIGRCRPENLEPIRDTVTVTVEVPRDEAETYMRQSLCDEELRAAIADPLGNPPSSGEWDVPTLRLRLALSEALG
jgi:hypothetical protein